MFILSSCRWSHDLFSRSVAYSQYTALRNINDWREDKFAKAWMDMRKKGTIIKVGTDDKEKNLYKLSSEQVKLLNSK